MDRHAVNPAVLVARTVIVFVPINNRIVGMLQLVGPIAVPDPPVEFTHVTVVMPVLSRAVPLTAIELADTENVVRAGETTAKLGGAVLLPGELGAYDTCSALLTVAPFCATAVTVRTLIPLCNAIAPVLQTGVPDACPAPP